MKRESLLNNRGVLFVVVCLLSMLFSSFAYGQSGSSSVRGNLVDPQSRPLAGVTVTLSNAEKNFSRSQTTNETGAYSFNTIPPGTYRIEVEGQGFKKAVVADVRAQVDTPTNIDVQLEVGNVSETVSVSAGGEAPINTTDATIGNTFESRRIEELPLNARNVVNLLSLQPGVTQGGYVNGGRSDQANITLDGVDVNEQQRGLDVVTGGAFSSVLRVTPDSVQEFRVITTNPNAEQGRSSGAQVSLVTKSGTNDWHGLLYEYHRNTVTTANDFFNNKAGVKKPALLRNIFGGSTSGPIKHDRAYYFFTYEGFREATATSVVRTVPLKASMGQGIIRYRNTSGAADPTCPSGTPAGFTCLTPAQITAFYAAANGGLTPGTSPAAIALLRNAANTYVANDTTVGDGSNTGGFRFNALTPTKYNTFIGKFDLNITNRQQMFLRGNYQDDNIGGAPQFPGLPAPTTWNHPKGLAVGHTWTINDHIVNNFVYGLTRLSVSTIGDSDQNQISFRNVFTVAPTRTFKRVTPLHNFADDISWIRGYHSLQFGTNIRLISNTRDSFANSYDFLQTNLSGYDFSGAVLTRAGIDASGALTSIFPGLASTDEVNLRNALAAYIGRFSGYSANFLYGPDGKILPVGSSSKRTFATQELDLYAQDSWRLRPNLTINFGLRWNTSTPVYESTGFEVVPTTSLSDFFEARKAGAEKGVPYNTPITLDKGGKFYDKPGYYNQDWNNFGPSIAIAYSPNFHNWIGKLMGNEGKSSIRAGFRKTFDHIGNQLAVNFDGSNVLGFASSLSIPVNTYNISTRLAPQYTGGIPDARTLPGIAGNFGNTITFPLTQPSDQAQRIETSLDSGITTPFNYNVAMSYERELRKGLKVQVAYVGRFARKLLAQRDVATMNNLRDPKSGQTFYEAFNLLVDARLAGAPINTLPSIPFFENVTPGLAANVTLNGTVYALTATQRAYRSIALPKVGPCTVTGTATCGQNVTDYTFRQLQWDDPPIAFMANIFFHPQYGALQAWSTIAKSNYNSAQISVTQRFTKDITFDFNYTYGNSLDNASGLQASANYSSAALILNPLDPDSQYANSDFDIRHIINANWLVGLPFGHGKALLHDSGKVVNGILGGWQLTGIFRWNSGLPTGGPFGSNRWPTNWNISSSMVRTAPVQSDGSNNVAGVPNLFANPLAAYLSFRDARAGEAGDRNVLRLPGYIALDAGLSKTFHITEKQRVSFRWEVYNVTNTQRLTSPSGFGIAPVDPFLQGQFGLPPITAAPATFGTLTSTQKPLGETKAGRVMQFALRYQF